MTLNFKYWVIRAENSTSSFELLIVAALTHAFREIFAFCIFAKKFKISRKSFAKRFVRWKPWLTLLGKTPGKAGFRLIKNIVHYSGGISSKLRSVLDLTMSDRFWPFVSFLKRIKPWRKNTANLYKNVKFYILNTELETSA